MKALLEKTDDCDYLEIILFDEDIDEILGAKGLSQEFLSGFSENAPLNIFFRKATAQEISDRDIEKYIETQGEEECL